MTELDQVERLARLQQRRRANAGRAGASPVGVRTDRASDGLGTKPGTRRRARPASTSTRVATTSMAAAAMCGLVAAMALATANNDDESTEPIPTYVVEASSAPVGSHAGLVSAPTPGSETSTPRLPDAVRDTRTPVVRLTPVHSASVTARSRAVALAPQPAPAPPRRRAATNASR